jgi:hypothetical protein
MAPLTGRTDMRPVTGISLAGAASAITGTLGKWHNPQMLAV